MAVRPSKVFLDPKGIGNSRNNCFFNASMQALLSNPTFVCSLLTDVSDSSLWVGFREFVFCYQDCLVVDPGVFLRLLKSYFPMFNGEEQDAHEFLLKFFEQLYLDAGGTLSVIDSEDELINMKKRNLICRAFFGLLSENFCCSRCKYQETRFQEFNVLSLNCFDSMRVCFEDYTSSTDIIDFPCPQCFVLGFYSKRVDFEITPDVLIVHFRRFTSSFSKDDRVVSLCSRLTVGEKDYLLTGVVLHDGSLGGGHYVCHARRKDKWYLFDDVTVREIECPNLESSEAYMLFFSDIKTL